MRINPALFLLLVLGLASCEDNTKDNSPPGADFNRQALFNNLGEQVILPAFLDFADQTDSLKKAALSFRTQPDLQSLEYLKTQWILTKYSSKRIEQLKFGPLNETKMYSLVDKWPTNEDFIEGFIKGSDPITESFIQTKGATSKGLPAIEYLLFENHQPASLLQQLTDEPRRVDYILACCTNLSQKALEIASLWSPLGDNYLKTYEESTLSGLDGSLSLTVNQMSAHLEFMLLTKLGKPLGKDLNREADPSFLEAYRSEISRHCLQENLIIFRQLFTGADGIGFDDYLDQLNARKSDQLLSEVILNQLDKVENQLQNIHPSLEGSLEKAATEELYQSLRSLVILIKADMSSALSVTLTLRITMVTSPERFSPARYFSSVASLAPLAVFRIIFGILMFFSVLRFWAYGWIHELYIEPAFHFKYYGFEWVQALSPSGMYGLFTLMGLSAIGMSLGLFYRLSSVLFFLSFTYVELIDVSTYLNHYYFVSLVAFIMIWLPAHRLYSLDVRFGITRPALLGPRFFVDILRLLLSIVYFYAGLAKLNPDWMLEALPMKIWLPSKAGLPLIGPLMDYEWVAYFFSWFGALYDLSIPFFLWNRKTRPYAYITVIVFHVLTWLLFPIGVFPWVMIFCTLVFFGNDFHQAILNRLSGIFKVPASASFIQARLNTSLRVFFILFLTWQILWPWRFMAYPGSLFWTEQGYRLSWRVMLIEKAGYVTFHITDPASGRTGEAHPSDYLTPNQEKQMSTQPDLILQFAHFLEAKYQEQGIEDPLITAEAYVTLNGQGSRLFIDPEADLTKKDDSFAPKDWILPYEN